MSGDELLKRAVELLAEQRSAMTLIVETQRVMSVRLERIERIIADDPASSPLLDAIRELTTAARETREEIADMNAASRGEG